jgi:hypothetical protein
MGVIKPISDRHELLIPTITRPCLLSANQQYRRACRVERIEHALGPALMLHSKLPHVGVLRPYDLGTMGVIERRAFLHE